MSKKRVLIVEDDSVFLDVWEKLLEEQGYEVHGYVDAGDAWRGYASTHQVDYLILDMTCDVDVVRAGTPFSKSMSAKNSALRSLGLTAHLEEYIEVARAEKPHITEVWGKSFNIERLVAKLEEWELKA
jgi:DNA-binding NtrC family response regulator